MVVLSILGYGSSWAFAGHAVDPAEHAVAGVVADQPIGSEESACDHCCHAAAHMVGLAPAPLTPYRKQPDSFRVACGDTLILIPSAPPLKPPRA
jgi:hypothetical protein